MYEDLARFDGEVTGGFSPTLVPMVVGCATKGTSMIRFHRWRTDADRSGARSKQGSGTVRGGM